MLLLPLSFLALKDVVEASFSLSQATQVGSLDICWCCHTKRIQMQNLTQDLFFSYKTLFSNSYFKWLEAHSSILLCPPTFPSATSVALSWKGLSGYFCPQPPTSSIQQCTKESMNDPYLSMLMHASVPEAQGLSLKHPFCPVNFLWQWGCPVLYYPVQ